MKAVEKLLLLTQPETGVQPTPCEGAARLKEALTWAACEKAISRFKKGKAVGSDLLDGYLLRIATEDIRKDYWRLLVEIVETKEYPREWNDWIAMLAMKPGEDPKELERRRDLWIQPQSRRRLSVEERGEVVAALLAAQDTSPTASPGRCASHWPSRSRPTRRMER